jgi:hypothetical protein
MRVLLGLVAAVCCAFSLSAEAACLSPAPPGVPDGKTASAETMNETAEAVNTYIRGLEAYQACLRQQDQTAPADTTPDQRKIWLSQYNNSVDKMEELAKAFNEQLRIYKARGK